MLASTQIGGGENGYYGRSTNLGIASAVRRGLMTHTVPY